MFAGGGPLEEAEAVCSVAGGEPPVDVASGLERLAEHSLVRIEPDVHGDVRFGPTPGIGVGEAVDAV